MGLDVSIHFMAGVPVERVRRAYHETRYDEMTGEPKQVTVYDCICCGADMCHGCASGVSDDDPLCPVCQDNLYVPEE